ncbi:MAG TPA: ECF transporter S component [Acidimicrobiia bacterium]|nr:ECF transporter S component [Acidimicrobiia bacterium]
MTASMPARRSVIPVRSRSGITLGLAAVASILAFAWPLFISSDSSLAQTDVAPLLFALVLPLVGAVVIGEIAGGGLDAKTVAMLGVLSALGAALRPLGAGAGGVELVFFMIVLGGRAFGPGFGFVLGSTTLVVSAFITGGVGPWLPYQMLAASWVGMGAGLLPALGGRKELALLAAYGALSSLVFGLLMNLSFWPFTLGPGTSLSFVPGAPVTDNLGRFLGFSLATSLGWDLGRAVTTAGMIALVGGVVLRSVRRVGGRAGFEADVTFADRAA